MKVTDYMVGDWVMNPNDGKCYKIHTVTAGEQTRLSNPYNLTDLEFHLGEPIPITSGILEKNGWINKEAKGWIQKGNFGDSPLMLWYIKDTGKFNPHFAHELEMSDLSKDGGFRIKVQCKYVHELQHALRLCGLGDLADNFKV